MIVLLHPEICLVNLERWESAPQAMYHVHPMRPGPPLTRLVLPTMVGCGSVGGDAQDENRQSVADHRKEQHSTNAEAAAGPLSGKACRKQLASKRILSSLGAWVPVSCWVEV